MEKNKDPLFVIYDYKDDVSTFMNMIKKLYVLTFMSIQNTKKK